MAKKRGPKGPNKVFGFNAGRQAEFIEMLELGLTRNRACDFIGVSPATVSVFLKDPKNVKYLNNVKKAEVACEVDALRRIKAGKIGWQSAAWLLERKWPETWSMKKPEDEVDRDDTDPEGLA